MKKIILSLVLFLFAGNAFAQNGWVVQNPFQADSVSSPYFVNENLCFIMGQNNLILRSTNAGLNWVLSNQGAVNVLSQNKFTFIKFFNDTTGIAGSDYLYKSTDAGSNWTLLSGIKLSNYNFLNLDTGFAISTTGEKKYLAKTFNGGLNWIVQDSLASFTSKLFFINSQTGFSISKTNLFKTENQGQNWSVVWTSAGQVYPTDVNFQNQLNGYACAGFDLLKSTNGGLNWYPHITLAAEFYKILINSESNIFISVNRNSSSKTIAYSTNSGINWSYKVFNFPQPAANVELSLTEANSSLALATSSPYTIFRTTNSGVSFINTNSENNIYEEIKQMQIFDANNAIANTASIYLLKTSNGGSNWTKINPFPGACSEIFFLNKDNGFTIQNNKLYKSNNGGENWQIIPRPGSALTQSDIHNLYFKNINTGYCMYDSIAYQSVGFHLFNKLAVTYDGGQSWSFLFEIMGSSFPSGAFISHKYIDLEFLNSNTGFIVDNVNSSGGYSASLLKTTNGGLNVEQCFYDDSIKINGAKFVNTSIGYVSFKNVVDPNNISKSGMLKTTNGGVNWFKVNDYSPSKFVFVNESIGYSDGYVTTNGGSNWLYQFTPTQLIRAISFYGLYTGLMAGDNGIIYKTGNGGGVSVSQISSVIPKNVELYQNYPNPFNPSTKINYEIKSSGLVSMKVFDLLGKEVAQLVNEKQNAGSYAVDFNSTEFNLPSGIYFYTLNAGEFKETKKMVLIK